MREFSQAGVELVGADAPDGTAEVIEILSAALDAIGLTRAVIGLGDADLYRQLLTELDVPDDQRKRILELLAEHDLVGLEAEVDALGLGSRERETLLRLPNLRGGSEVLEEARQLGGAAVERASGTALGDLPRRGGPRGRPRINLDLGLLRDLGYYTGAILEVYDPALGHVLGGGGRYDDLMGRFGGRSPRRGSRSTWSACTSRRRRRTGSASGRRPRHEARRGLRQPRSRRRSAQARGAARCPVRRDAGSARPDRRRHRRRCGPTRAR